MEFSDGLCVWGGVRSSNFETLRLLCMLMVLNLHSFHGWYYGGGIWQALDFFRESTSVCAVDVFLLISGYFGIKWKFKSFFRLVFQVFFYSVGIYLVAVLFQIVEWNIKDFLTRFACLFYDSWGFVIGYVILYFLSPVLNSFAQFANPRQYLLLILGLFIATNFICLSSEGQLVLTYSLVYMIGRFLNKYRINQLPIATGKAYFATTLIIFILVYFFLFGFLHLSSASSRIIGNIGYRYCAILVILQAVFLFLYFSHLNFKSRFINWMAESSFAIFLIHMHPTIKTIGYESFTRSLYNYPEYLHITYLVVLILTVFFLSIIIDKLRIFMSNIFYLVIMKFADKSHLSFAKMESLLFEPILKKIEL